MALPKASGLMSLKKAIVESLKCPKCRVVMWPPIRHCVKGHSFCHECYDDCKIYGCHICDGDCNSNHTYHLERIFDFLPIDCKYADIGCQISLPYKQLKNHESTCVVYWSCCFDELIKEFQEKTF